MEFWLLYLLTGAVAGVLAGLLGVGGGLVIVPALTAIFTAQHFPPETILRLALGTSLASILFTAISSARKHHAHGAVNWVVLRGITPGIVTGTLLGASLATLLSSDFLKGFFVVFVYYVAVQMLFDLRPGGARPLPGKTGLFLAGSVIGAVSSLVGIGGGTLSVPFMTWCRIRMHEAIGTSSAIGFPIAAAGAIGYIANGWNTPGLPVYSLGFVYLPALAGLVATSVLTAPLGAKAAHRLPVKQLKKLFALLLVLVGTRMWLRM
jgi:uncharacterized membrane protein YfcA